MIPLNNTPNLVVPVANKRIRQVTPVSGFISNNTGGSTTDILPSLLADDNAIYYLDICAKVSANDGVGAQLRINIVMPELSDIFQLEMSNQVSDGNSPTAILLRSLYLQQVWTRIVQHNVAQAPGESTLQTTVVGYRLDLIDI